MEVLGKELYPTLKLGETLHIWVHDIQGERWRCVIEEFTSTTEVVDGLSSLNTCFKMLKDKEWWLDRHTTKHKIMVFTPSREVGYIRVRIYGDRCPNVTTEITQ